MAKVPNFDLFAADELDVTISAAVEQNPSLTAELEDALALQCLLDELVRLRKLHGLTQTDVARLMGVRQPTVSQFETESSDPRLSTLQRYARAVGARLTCHVMTATGVFSSYQPYVPSVSTAGRPRHVAISRMPLAHDWASRRRSDFVLVG